MKFNKSIYRHIFFIICTIAIATHSAPTQRDSRRPKSLAYFDYVQSTEEDGDMQNFIDENEDFPNDSEHYEQFNELSRTVPTSHRRKLPNAAPRPSLESPIYYIRLPPQPYVYVPGLGYVSQPTQTGPGALLNLPVDFVSNGKPGAIYQWSGGFSGVATPIKPVPKPHPPKAKQRPKPVDSKFHRLPGKYVFNGKPNEIYALGDSYNSIYGDTLHSFYP